MWVSARTHGGRREEQTQEEVEGGLQRPPILQELLEKLHG